MVPPRPSPWRPCGAGLVATLLLVAASAAGAQVTRGPYLQLASDTSIMVVWRTDVAGVGRVRYGTAPNALTAQASEATASRTHAVRLSGLTAATRYFYAVDLDGTPLNAGPGLGFRTYPPPGSTEPFRFFAWGDSGDASTQQLQVANSMVGQVGPPDFALILGDIVYPDGSAANQDPRFFTPYLPLLRQMVIWPTIGENDLISDNGASYASAFYLPLNNPQASPLYYSFDYGNAHFVCLATDGVPYGPGSQQLAWAANDLAASNATWKFVFFHRPPYSGGTAPDDLNVQAGIVPLMDQFNVDMVFSGHSHVYERTYLLQGGTIAQGDPSLYTKYSTTTPGTLYLVSGAGGESGPLSNPGYSRMAFQQGDVVGNLVIDVAGPVARGYFLLPDGSAQDFFTLAKGADADPPRVLGLAGASTQVVLSFNEPVAAGSGSGGAENPGNYAISPAVQVNSAVLGPDLRTVTLTTTPQTAGTSYTLTITGVQDRATPPNTIVAGTRLTYAFQETGGADGGTGGTTDVGGGTGSPAPSGSGQGCGCGSRAAPGALLGGGLWLLGLAVGPRRRPPTPRG